LRPRLLQLDLGPVDRRVRHRIDKEIRPEFAHQPDEGLRPDEVLAGEVGDLDRPQGEQLAMQLPPELTRMAEEEDLHAGCPDPQPGNP
jgi:hypothetical protein